MLRQLTKAALVDLVLIHLQPGFNQWLMLDKLLIDGMLRMKRDKINKTILTIKSLNRSDSGYRKVWLELNDKIDKLQIEHDKLLDLAYPKYKGVGNG